MKLQAKVQQLVAQNVPTIAFTMEDKQLTAMGVKTALERMKTDLHTITGFELLKMVQSLLVEGDGEQQLEFAKFVFPVFPKLPFPLTSEDWDWRLARDTLTLYMNILGWKVGGNSYTDKSNIPPGWPNSMDYNDFKGPSWEAKIIIRSLLIHHGYDPDVHHVPVTENNNNNKKRRARKSKSKTSAPIIEEDEERRIEEETGGDGQETGDAVRNEDEDRITVEDRREDVTDMNEGEEYTDMAAVDLDSVPMLLEDGEGQHYVYADVVQRPQDGGGDSQEGEDTAPGEVIGGENTAPRVVTVAAVEAARSMILHGAVDDVNISSRRLSLPTIVDSIDPGADITWPIAINPDVFKNYPSESQMRSWPWPSTSSTSPPLQNDHSDTEEESAYEKLQRKNIQEKEKKLADLGIASEVTNAKKPLKRKTKNIPSSSEPIRKSRRLATKR